MPEILIYVSSHDLLSLTSHYWYFHLQCATVHYCKLYCNIYITAIYYWNYIIIMFNDKNQTQCMGLTNIKIFYSHYK